MWRKKCTFTYLVLYLLPLFWAQLVLGRAQIYSREWPNDEPQYLSLIEHPKDPNPLTAMLGTYWSSDRRDLKGDADVGESHISPKMEHFHPGK